VHPFHPLYGHEFEAIEKRDCWGDERLFYTDKSGCLSYIPVSWTDYLDEDLFVTTAAGRSRLHILYLSQLVMLIQPLVSKAVK
jgi:hypothetical protein